VTPPDNDYIDERPSNHWPPSFSEWPIGQKITRINMRQTREGLLRNILSHCGVHKEVSHDTKLTTREWAAIYLRFEGYDGDRSRPADDRWPSGFESWPLEDQLEEVQDRFTRPGLVYACLSHAGLDPEQYQVRDDTKVRKNELAAIYISLEGF
jgi:hypothetical protein